LIDVVEAAEDGARARRPAEEQRAGEGLSARPARRHWPVMQQVGNAAPMKKDRSDEALGEAWAKPTQA